LRPQVPGRRGKRLFYFSRDKGVIAYYTTIDESHAASEDAAALLANSVPMLTYFLVSETGFLKAPLKLEKVSSTASEAKQTVEDAYLVQ
jgi:hypothetical protein